MRCENLGPRLSAWVDGELSGLSAWLIARHVASCPTCTAEVEGLRALNARLSAANPITDPLFEPVISRRPLAPLVGAGALVAAGVAGFFLLPRAPQSLPKNSESTPAIVAQEASDKRKLDSTFGIAPSGAPRIRKPNAITPKTPLPGPAVAAETRSSVAPEPVNKKRNRLQRAISRRKSHQVARETERPRRRPRRQVSTEPIRVAKAARGERDLLMTPDRMASLPEKPIDSVGGPVTESLQKKASEPLGGGRSGGGPDVPMAPRPVAPATVAEPLSDAMIKRDARARMAFGAMPKASVRREEPQEASAPRKKVVPVLVVTPTRYENVVTVTAAALEVDDTDNKEETPQS